MVRKISYLQSSKRSRIRRKEIEGRRRQKKANDCRNGKREIIKGTWSCVKLISSQGCNLIWRISMIKNYFIFI